MFIVWYETAACYSRPDSYVSSIFPRWSTSISTREAALRMSRPIAEAVADLFPIDSNACKHAQAVEVEAGDEHFAIQLEGGDFVSELMLTRDGFDAIDFMYQRTPHPFLATRFLKEEAECILRTLRDPGRVVDERPVHH